MSVQNYRYRRLLPFAVLGATLWSGDASAHPEFPTGLRKALDMSCTPSCTVCHETDPGNASNAKKDFADVLRDIDGFPGAGKQEDVENAINQLPDNINTDGDDRTDKEELRTNPPTDPNFGVASDPMIYGENMCAGEVEYGCGAHLASLPRRSGDRTWGWALFGLGLGLILTARRRTQRN